MTAAKSVPLHKALYITLATLHASAVAGINHTVLYALLTIVYALLAVE